MMSKKMLAITLAVIMAFTACTTGWVSTLNSILAAAAPALINILQIVAISKGTSVDPALVSKINTDAAQVKKLAADFAAASGATGPAACSQLQAALATYSADLPEVLAGAQVSNENTQAKIVLLSGLVFGVFQSIEPLIPSCAPQAVNAMKAQLKISAPPLPLKNFVASYNAVLTAPTGEASVDVQTPKMKLKHHFWQ